MKKPSIKMNAFLNVTRTISSILMQLLTFPYVSHVLQVTNIGKVSFSQSVISYFVLIGGLGISTYASREGARIRENKDEFSLLSNEIFTINLISTLIAYVFLVAMCLLFPFFKTYWILLAIQSITIICTTLGVEWIYMIYEDYVYITVRTISVQIVSTILIFLLVKTPNDYILYAVILTCSNSLGFLFNFIHSKKYLRIKIISKPNLKKHLKPIFTIFSVNVSQIVYLNSDSTMLGIISGDYYVGLYSIANKIYNVLKNLLAAIYIVTLPSLSNLLGKNQNSEYRNRAGKTYMSLMIFTMPIIVFLLILAKPILLILGGKNYIPSMLTIRILAISIFFSMLSNFYMYVVLIPLKRESACMRATLIGALTNIVLNLFLIPFFYDKGAAFSTLIAEIVVFIWELASSRKIFRLQVNKRDLYSVFLATLLMLSTSCFIGIFKFSWIASTVMQFFFSGASYVFCLYYMKNSVFISFCTSILKFVK